MSANYSIRNYRPDDFTAYHQLMLLSGEMTLAGCGISPEEVTVSLNRPGHTPERDLFIAEIGGAAVGYLDISPELPIGRAILICWVASEHRRRGLATRLVARAVIRVRELGVEDVQICVPDDDAAGKGMVLSLGFGFARCFLKLRISLAAWSMRVDTKEITLRDMGSAGIEELVEIQNRSFDDTWGFCPNTLAEITHCIELSRSSPRDIILAYDDALVIGYCWTKPGSGPGSLNETGQISMLGVAPEYRGTGLGRKLMLAGLAHLKDRGLKTAWLEVDAENKAALGLYRSLGFRKYASSSWYQKPLG